jgi:hypothetical protein
MDSTMTTTATKAKAKPGLDEAKEMDKKFKNLRVAFRRHWTIYGQLAIKFEKKEYFKLLGFDSMKQYLKSLEDACYSTIAEAMSVIKSLPEIAPDDMAQYPKENLKILAKMPESKRTKLAVLEKCRSMKSRDFRAFVSEKHDLALEEKTRYIIDCEPSQTVIFDGLVAMVQKAAEAQGMNINKAEAFEYACVDVMQRLQDKKPESVKLQPKIKRSIKLAPGESK